MNESRADRSYLKKERKTSIVQVFPRLTKISYLLEFINISSLSRSKIILAIFDRTYFIFRYSCVMIRTMSDGLENIIELCINGICERLNTR